MSKHNYSQYSNKPKQNNNYQSKYSEKVEPEVKTPVVKMEAEKVVPVTEQPKLLQETVETVALPDRVVGTVVNCVKLNVRENCTVDSGIVCVLDAKSEIEIDVKKSVTDWFYIYTAIGAEGYCMKQYVEAHM